MTFWTKKPESAAEGKGPAAAAPSAVKTVAPQQAPAASTPGSVATVDYKGVPLSIEESLTARFGKVRSALGPGTVIQGKLSFDTPVRMDGKLSGEVYSSRALIVGESGAVEADLDVAALIVLGAVKGNVKASERIEILPGGSVDGDVAAPVFVVEEGGRFNGSCRAAPQRASLSGLDRTGKPAEKDKDAAVRAAVSTRTEVRA